jgi:hypothetical protein
MTKNTVDESFHQIIRNVWHCLYAYNQGKSNDGVINGLATIKEQIDTLIHHLKNS